MDKLYNDFALKTKNSPYAGKRLVFGAGSLTADIFMIGEAPGGEEEKLGKPFVGKAGKNLDSFLAAVQLPRESVYISNVVKLRPTSVSPKTGRPVNRPPSREEIEFFKPLLFDEIRIVSPKLIVTLGNVPLRAVLNDESASIGGYHGKPTQAGGLCVFPLYHPAAVIYRRELKKIYDDDLIELKKYIGG